MTVPSRLIHADAQYRVDLFHASQPTSRLLITFTEFGNRTLEGTGFAGKFALDHGFDLVAIKGRTDDWYASFPDEAFSAVTAVVQRSLEPYAWRGCFGSSMGAYASLLFAKRLNADVALAYSPQFDISQDWDRRWHRNVPTHARFRTMVQEDVSPQCRYVIAFDPCDTDRRHVREFAAVIPPDRLALMPMAYAGHPVGLYLRATGQLKAFPQAVFSGGEASRALLASSRSRRTDFDDFYFNLAGHCLRRGKLRAARSAIAKARQRKPWHPEVLIRAAQVDERLNDLPSAAAWAALSVAMSPKHPHFAATLARILHKGGRHSEALHHISAALALSESNVPFEVQRNAIRAALAASRARQ